MPLDEKKNRKWNSQWMPWGNIYFYDANLTSKVWWGRVSEDWGQRMSEVDQWEDSPQSSLTGWSLSEEEMLLYDLVMEYRGQYGLPAIPLSESLTIVAQTHVLDLQKHRPFNNTCNMHSWSANGEWTSCCYTSDHAEAECMWNKPRELTTYSGNGFEIAHGYTVVPLNSETSTSPSTALKGWKSSKGHNEVIINKGVWQMYRWRAVGIGMSQHFAVIWFGEEID